MISMSVLNSLEALEGPEGLQNAFEAYSSIFHRLFLQSPSLHVHHETPLLQQQKLQSGVR